MPSEMKSKVVLPPFVKFVREGRMISLKDRPEVTTPKLVADLMDDLRCEEVEVVRALYLDTKSRVIFQSEITRGLVDASLIHPREVFRPAISAGAVAVIVVHNHPSGVETPSAEDNALTRQLVAAGRVIDIPVYDHVIIGNPGYYSYSERGAL